MTSRYSHCNACHAVCSVPEAHGTTIRTLLRWHPGHDKKEDLDQDEQANRNIPRLELGPLNTELTTLTPNKVHSDRHGEEEERLGVILEVDNCRQLSARSIDDFKVLTWRIPKLKASPAGGARIINTVIAHFSMYGPMGVPKGLVVTQNLGYGNTPCLPISRMSLD